jgi:hypothetical protein
MLILLAGLDPAGVLTTTLRVDPGAIPEESLHCSVFWSIQITLEQRPVTRPAPSLTRLRNRPAEIRAAAANNTVFVSTRRVPFLLTGRFDQQKGP